MADTFDGNLQQTRKQVKELEEDVDRITKLLEQAQTQQRELLTRNKQLILFTVRQIVNSSLPFDVRVAKLHSFVDEFFLPQAKKEIKV